MRLDHRKVRTDALVDPAKMNQKYCGTRQLMRLRCHRSNIALGSISRRAVDARHRSNVARSSPIGQHDNRDSTARTICNNFTY
eukprot:3286567-Pleurochrysis_carterae.AAC.2